MSLVTYTAVIAVRYPELDNVQNDLVCFGNYLLGEQATSWFFLSCCVSVLASAPYAPSYISYDVSSHR